MQLVGNRQEERPKRFYQCVSRICTIQAISKIAYMGHLKFICLSCEWRALVHICFEQFGSVLNRKQNKDWAR